MEDLSYRKRVRVDSAESEFDFDFDSIKAKRVKDELLSLLDDSDTVPDCDSASHDLDSVIRSFEEEIGSSSASGSSPATLIDLTSDSGDNLPELGQFSVEDVGTLGETQTRGGDVSEFIRVSAELSGIGELWDFQDEFSSYGSFGLGVGYEQDQQSNEYVSSDGIFDFSDVNFGSDLLWRQDALPA